MLLSSGDRLRQETRIGLVGFGVETAEFALGHGGFDPNQDVTAIVQIVQFGQMVRVQWSAGTEDFAETTALDRIDPAVIDMFPIIFCGVHIAPQIHTLSFKA